jgi:glycosyltransferase involved in cell wall biosynthesis
MQNYQNYRIVFIDDASTDDTGQEVQYFMKMQTKIPT